MRNRLVAAAVLIVVALPICAATISNNDSCDIGVYPAATLLLPYFEVDLSPVAKKTTIFSITNVSPQPQIANVTLWTDFGFPVLSFRIFLSGYDVQPINLYDVIARGFVGSFQGTSIEAPNARNSKGQPTNQNVGTQPALNTANAHFGKDVSILCGHLPGVIEPVVAQDARLALTTGVTTGQTISCPLPDGTQARVGADHGASTAVGYATVDVVSTCSTRFAIDGGYWPEVLNDNVLTGDYQQIALDPALGNYAGGNPMVHIRAVPGVALPFTFYDRFTKTDARQPLPSTFAARWIEDQSSFVTEYKIWREPLTPAATLCSRYQENASMPYIELVRFDERENAFAFGQIGIPEPPFSPTLPATARVPISAPIFPNVVTTDSGGWMYFNLYNGNTRGASQNWVTVSMFAEGRFGVEQDATSLGNGCSAPAAPSSTGSIAPRPLNVTRTPSLVDLGAVRSTARL